MLHQAGGPPEFHKVLHFSKVLHQTTHSKTGIAYVSLIIRTADNDRYGYGNVSSDVVAEGVEHKTAKATCFIYILKRLNQAKYIKKSVIFFCILI